MEYLKKSLSFKVYAVCILLSICSIIGCKEDNLANIHIADAQIISSMATQMAVGSATNKTVKFFDAELNKRKNLSSYTKTSSSSSAMVINPNFIRVVNDPVFGAKRKVMRMTVRPGDNGGVTANPRAQVQTPMSYVEGQEVFVGFSVRFTKKIWTHFLTFSELYGAPYKGTAPFRLAIQESNIIASSYDGSKQVNLWKEPMQANIWYDFVYREVLSKDAAKGEVEVWMRKSGERNYKVVLPAKKMATITAVNLTGPNYHKLACYYDKNYTFTDGTKKTKVSAVEMYFGSHKVGRSFADVAPALLR